LYPKAPNVKIPFIINALPINSKIEAIDWDRPRKLINFDKIYYN
jgi:hypothetical protein